MASTAVRHAEPTGGHDLPGGSTVDNGVSGTSGDNGLPGPRSPGPDNTAPRSGEAAAPATSATRQPVLRPSFMLDGPTPYGRPGSLTLEQIEEVQVHRANEEPGYFEHHYRKDGTRKDTDLHDARGFTPPQLTQLMDDGPWVRAKGAPAPPKPHFLDTDYIAARADNVTSRARLRVLEAAAQKRYFAIQWDNLAEKWKAEAGNLNRIHDTGTYTGYQYRCFDINKRTLP